jgi:hypothetical protein
VSRPGTDDLAREAAEGISRLEGYLLLQADEQVARSQARAFADRLPWLTTAQREEVVSVYAEERMALSVQVLRAVARRCHELQDQYTERYEALRARTRCRATACVLLCLSLSVTAVLLSLTG